MDRKTWVELPCQKRPQLTLWNILEMSRDVTVALRTRRPGFRRRPSFRNSPREAVTELAAQEGV